MIKLKTLLFAAKLRSRTHLKAKTRNSTMWSSTHDMLTRYVRLREFIPKLGLDDLDDMTLPLSENRRVDALLHQMKDFEFVTKVLQSISTTFVEFICLFDAVLDKFPETTARLSASASIVYSSYFASAVCKVQPGTLSALSWEERDSLRGLESETVKAGNSVDSESTFVERALKRQKRASTGGNLQYKNLRFVLSTSNIFERLFS
eukprot:IDg1416t1